MESITLIDGEGLVDNECYRLWPLSNNRRHAHRAGGLRREWVKPANASDMLEVRMAAPFGGAT